jgi:hypothetical protein
MRRISVDASLWGIGGILYHNNQPISYFADNIAQHDLNRISATTGDPAFNALWEALAIPVALRSWRSSSTAAVIFQVRSDSLSALSSIFEGFSRSPRQNNIVSEIFLDEAELYNSLAITVHVPGVTKIQPDALSRLSAPSPSSIPQALHSVPRLQPLLRDKGFWLTQRPERKAVRRRRRKSVSTICPTPSANRSISQKT